MTLRTLNYGNYGIFLIMGNAGFCPSAVLQPLDLFRRFVVISCYNYWVLDVACFLIATTTLLVS